MDRVHLVGRSSADAGACGQVRLRGLRAASLEQVWGCKNGSHASQRVASLSKRLESKTPQAFVRTKPDPPNTLPNLRFVHSFLSVTSASGRSTCPIGQGPNQEADL